MSRSDIFISYARSTAKQAERIAQTLRSLGYSVWRDDELPANRVYGEVIEERLREAKVVVVVWSAEAARSQWVRAEADVARLAGTLVQLRVDDASPPLPFNQIQCVDLSGWSGEDDAPGWRKVAESVAELVERSPQPLTVDAAPGPPPRDRAGSPSPASPAPWPTLRVKPWRKAAAALLVVALAAGAAWLFTARPSPSHPVMRVAVLPFDAVGQGQDARSFADTLMNEIISALSANQIETVSRTDSAALTGPDARAQIARLGVGLVLDGIVRSDGKSLAVRVHLDDARAHMTLWSKTFEARLPETDVLQMQIAGRAADVTKWAASQAVDSVRNNPNVLAAYLEGYDRLVAGEPDRSLVIFRDVVARAPKFSQGHSLLAWAISDESLNLPADAQEGALPEEIKEAKLALALDPTNDQADTLLANDMPMWAWREREALLLKGLGVDANSFYLHWSYSIFLDEVGRSRDALVQAQQAIAGDPLDVDSRVQRAMALVLAGQPDEAAAKAAEARRLWPDNPNVAITALRVAAYTQRPSQALALIDDPLLVSAIGSPAGVEAWRAIFKAVLSGSAARKRAVASKVAAAADGGAIFHGDAVAASCALGDIDGAFQEADRASSLAILRQPASPTTFDTTILFQPGTKALRRDSRFMALAARLGLVDYWRSSNRWPDFCAEPGLPYDCRAQAARLPSGHSRRGVI